MKTQEISSISFNNYCCCANMYMQKHANYLGNITLKILF